ncbi:PGAP1-like protein [Neofusicoccum parvum]|uniref:PGAP1-like protein n=2 Tax=Neofusicoccum parvum TaxID=310453 RepID=A0ACB5S0R1_9PEZI|nr:putative pgap1-like protein [Neofusicoccum parvum UCRNP2]GME26353.1 PGAP1-like protein [Neofusicoccum parvum]GME48234.1 PGAP1-like protein [Neofusicoccum parvum]
MKKTLLLCFIHGFKGDDDTFRKFPQHLRGVLENQLPKLTVLAVTYPHYETRGDLQSCVAKFKEWLQNKVIDLEVANGTPSPTVDPSPIHSTPSDSTSLSPQTTLMFPYIQGILAFDTPYLGISPGVVAHGAEGHWNTATAAYNAYNNVANTFGWGKKQATDPDVLSASKMLPAASSSADPNVDTAVVPAWQRFGKIAMFAGAAGALAAAGGAAYMNREQLSEGWQFVGSHLEFVGCLARQEEMKKRVAAVLTLSESQAIGFTDLYTQLGLAVQKQGNPSTKWSSGILGEQRTFCIVPKTDIKKHFVPVVNDNATAETWAHMTMFEPKNHPNYYSMAETAKELIMNWTTTTSWYEEATGYDPPPRAEEGADDPLAADEDLEMIEKPDVDQDDYEDLAESMMRRRT